MVRQRALLIVSCAYVVAAFFKNGFIFLANNSMAFIRASTVRDLRKKMYHKVLKLPLSFFTDARKGDLMTRISNDVQEIEISVIASLTMIFRDPMYYPYLCHLPLCHQLSADPFCPCPASGKRMAYRTGKPYTAIIVNVWFSRSLAGCFQLWRRLFPVSGY